MRNMILDVVLWLANSNYASQRTVYNPVYQFGQVGENVGEVNRQSQRRFAPRVILYLTFNVGLLNRAQNRINSNDLG